MPDEYGTNLAPNTATSMAVQLNKMKRMPAPYTSNCMSDWRITNYSVPRDANYSLSVSSTPQYLWYQSVLYQLCQRLCHQAAVATNCSCYWPELFIPALVTTTTNLRPCDTRIQGSKDRLCYQQTINQFDTRNRSELCQITWALLFVGARVCPCEVACQEKHYESTASVATWPSNQVGKAIVRLWISYLFLSIGGYLHLMLALIHKKISTL